MKQLPVTTAEGVGSGKALNAKAAEFWDIANRAEMAIGKMEIKAIPHILVAGAAFQLAKAEVPHGEWERMIQAASPFALRTVQMRMAAVDNVLLKLNYQTDRRAYETLVLSSKYAKAHDRALLKTPFAKGLTRAINDALKGKSGHQIELELGIRAQKRIGDGGRDGHAAGEKSLKDQAGEYLSDVCEGINALGRLGKHLEDEQRSRLAWALFGAMTRQVPAGWLLLVQRNNDERSVEPLADYLAGEYGKRGKA